MKIKIILLTLIFVFLSFVPNETSAFWWFQKKNDKAVTNVSTVNNVATPKVLSETEKANTISKLKTWKESFDKKNVESVIKNQNNFSFSLEELKYLIEVENKLAKKPAITNVGLTISNDNINVAANFHKFVSGRFSFIAKIISVDNKLRLKISYLKLYNFPVPAKWVEEPLNEALDDYFSFLYQDERYQGFSFIARNNLIQLKPEFKK